MEDEKINLTFYENIFKKIDIDFKINNLNFKKTNEARKDFTSEILSFKFEKIITKKSNPDKVLGYDDYLVLNLMLKDLDIKIQMDNYSKITNKNILYRLLSSAPYSNYFNNLKDNKENQVKSIGLTEFIIKSEENLIEFLKEAKKESKNEFDFIIDNISIKKDNLVINLESKNFFLNNSPFEIKIIFFLNETTTKMILMEIIKSEYAPFLNL
jgi:hypothetical protein